MGSRKFLHRLSDGLQPVQAFDIQHREFKGTRHDMHVAFDQSGEDGPAVGINHLGFAAPLASTSRFRPTLVMRPATIDTASARGRAASMVRTLPFTMIRSAAICSPLWIACANTIMPWCNFLRHRLRRRHELATAHLSGSSGTAFIGIWPLTLAHAQEREWLLDAADEDAFLVFGVPETDDVGVSLWCKIGSGKVKLFFPEGSAELKADSSADFTVTVGDKPHVLKGTTTENAMTGATSIETGTAD